MTSKIVRANFWLLAIIVVAAAVRWMNIGANPLWADEAHSFVISGASAMDLATAPLDPTGPLYYWLHKLFIPMNAGPTVARLISFACGVALIPAVYVTGRQFLDRRGALVASAITALAPLLVDYSQEARSYALLTLLCTCAAGFLLAADREADARRRTLMLLGFIVSSALALYTHMTGFLFVGSMCLVLLDAAFSPGAHLRKRQVVGCLLVLAAVSVPELLRMFQYATQTNDFVWLAPFGLLGFGKLLADEFLPFVKPLSSPAVYALVTAAFVGLAVMGIRRLSRGKSVRRTAVWVLLLWVSQPILQWLLGVFLVPVLMTRTLTLVWPGFALALALLTMALPGRRRGLAEGLLLLSYGATLFLTGTVRQKEDWNGATEEIRRVGSNMVLVCDWWKAPSFAATTRNDVRLTAVLHGGQFYDVGVIDAGDFGAAYRQSVWRLNRARWLGAPTLKPMVVDVRSVSIIRSECAQSSIDLLANVDAAPILMRRWVSPIGRDGFNAGLGEAAPISVETYRFEQPRQVRLLVPAL